MNIATPSEILSPDRFAGSKGMLAQNEVSQYFDLRFLPLNENNDFQNESLATFVLPLGAEGCDAGVGCIGAVAGEDEVLSFGFDKSNFFI